MDQGQNRYRNIGNRPKHIGNGPKIQKSNCGIGPYAVKKLGLIPKYSGQVPSAKCVLGLVPYPASALGLSP